MHQPEPGCKCGKLRPPRKLHAAIGLWLTFFLGVHLAICATGISPSQYQNSVDTIHKPLAYIPGAVLLLVILPVLFQMASGSFLTVKEGMKYDIKRCDRGGKFRFFLQRITGVAILAFLLLHIGSVYRWGFPLTYQSAFTFTASAFRPWSSSTANFITIALLFAGILGSVFHAANGLWSGAILWKAIQTPEGKTRWNYVCSALGLALAVMGSLAWYAFTLSAHAQPTVAATIR
jgi:succinate dehydrogenase / fumarate reductase cytochrome b subunit